ncbi:pectinesterase inhibitor 28-like [Brachypodium distachyon]|uniref:Pectinesterase inhibitor domain-containing protein n=1 Tax=Brachypodium distachyon TaxID=15368 RepID=A0A0Q3FSG5_BRADI|nr:pectinesterase inhibitor 28-like [Brachypodium distachyon]KQK02344.1 hypothetical protein BRADI_2g00915v3 [Brachypodium distachyon]|eukprot:XP_024315967.1 pectinesterase inhibitor 28-like [Brachypodium distachyon]
MASTNKKLKSLTSMASFLLLAAAMAGTTNADAGFVSRTCQKTKKATQCVSVLSADPDSASKATTESDLAGIALRLATATAGDAAAAAIDELAKGNPPGTPLGDALGACRGAYFNAAGVLKLDARQSFDGGDYAVASQLVAGAGRAGAECDSAFPFVGVAPAPELMAKVDRDMTERCAIAEELIELLVGRR